MSRNALWRNILLWSVGILGLFAAAHVLLDFVIEREVIRAGQESVGARVDVGDTRVSLLASRVSLLNVSVANPQSPLRNLMEADRCVVELEPTALLYKRSVVRHGAVTGLRFGTPRDTSGALADCTTANDLSLDAWLDEAAAKTAKDWLNRLHERFDRNLVEQLESIRLTEELLARWPAESAALEQRVRELRQRTADLDAQVRQAQKNPLRNVDFLESLPDEIKKIGADLTAISRDLEKLPSAAETDRRTIVAAREHDQRLLDGEMKFDPIDTNVLSAYLLQEQLHGPLGDLVGWLRWVRRTFPADAKPADAKSALAKSDQSKRRRGYDVLFAGCQRTPDFLIRTLELQGNARVGGQPLEFGGTLTNLTDKPTRIDEPMRLRLTSHGSLPLELQATIDRTGPVARDQLLIDCSGLVLPKLQLGSSKKLRLSLAPTTATINISITLEGDKLSGDVQLVQKQVQITPTVGDELAHHQLDEELAKTLGDVDWLATRISLDGTLDCPKCTVWSNLGPAVAEAMDRALVRTASKYTRDVIAQSHNRVNERLAELDRQMATTQDALKPQLAKSTDTLSKLGQESPGHRLSIDHLGRRLPADSLFR